VGQDGKSVGGKTRSARGPAARRKDDGAQAQDSGLALAGGILSPPPSASGHPLRDQLYWGVFLLSAALFFGALSGGFAYHLAQSRSLPWVADNDPLARGDEHMDGGRFELAMKEYGAAMAIDRGNFKAFFRFGFAAARAGQRDPAIAAFQHALELNPRCTDCHHRIGLIYLDEGLTYLDLTQLAHAIEEFRAALAINPDAAQVLSDLGIALAQVGDVQGAAATLTRALEIQPTLWAARQSLLEVLRKRMAARAGGSSP
jgi:tetratricopeptide (TPR) repeat protein